MIDKRLQAYRIYQRFIRIMLTISGCWYMPTKSGKTTYYWSIYLILTLILYSSVCLHASYILRHNMADMMKSIGLAISAYSAMLKIITFMINRGSLIKYHRILDDLFEEELMQNEKIRTIILSPLRTIHTLAYTYFIFLMGLVVAYSSPSYIVAIRGLYHHLIVTNYSLPISRRIGYFWTVPDNYLCHFYLVFETSLGLTSTIVACSVDNVFGFYVYQFISTMRAMTFRLTNPLPTEKFSDLLGKCVAKHQKLLRCRDTLEHVFGHIVFWHVISNAILVCGLMYDAVLMSDFNFANILVFLTYAWTKLFQTFNYAWYGTILTNAGEDFRNGIYFSEWTNSDFDRHVRTNVILIMMQEPMTVNAIFTPVDVVMFTSSVNTTMSYFFLLRSVSEGG